MARKNRSRQTTPTRPGGVRLRDVAERVGVHLSTVSRVLNPGAKGKVSDEVAARIRKVAAEMGYQTNAFGYGLKTQRSTTIGIIVPDLANPLFPPIIRAIEYRMQESGYTVIIGDSDSDPKQERKIVEKMIGRQVDGFILATAQLNDKFISQITKKATPVVLINRTTEAQDVVSVAPDDIKGMRLVTHHLVDLGHQCIAHVAGPSTLSTGRNRREGFMSAMRERSLKAPKNIVRECESYSEAAGRAAASAILDLNPGVTAIVTANDLLALGCYQALADHDLQCPKDISITGYNDMPFSDKFNPPLTTVNIDLHQMGDRAAEMLLSIIHEPDHERRSIELRPRLIVRASTAPPRLS